MMIEIKSYVVIAFCYRQAIAACGGRLLLRRKGTLPLRRKPEAVGAHAYSSAARTRISAHGPYRRGKKPGRLGVAYTPSPFTVTLFQHYAKDHSNSVSALCEGWLQRANAWTLCGSASPMRGQTRLYARPWTLTRLHRGQTPALWPDAGAGNCSVPPRALRTQASLSCAARDDTWAGVWRLRDSAVCPSPSSPYAGRRPQSAAGRLHSGVRQRLQPAQQVQITCRFQVQIAKLHAKFKCLWETQSYPQKSGTDWKSTCKYKYRVQIVNLYLKISGTGYLKTWKYQVQVANLVKKQLKIAKLPAIIRYRITESSTDCKIASKVRYRLQEYLEKSLAGTD